MDQTRIFGPLFALMALTAVVWVYMYARRNPFIRTARLTAEHLQQIEFARLSPLAVLNPSDNFRNLFIVRFWLYCASTLALGFMALRAGVAFIG